MTVPFWCVLIAIVLPYVFTGVAARAKVQQFGSIDNDQPRVQSAALTGAGARAYAAQQNAWEALAVFVPAVVIAHLAGADPGSSAIASVVFVVARVLHGAFYVADLATLRSLMFLVATICCISLFVMAATA